MLSSIWHRHIFYFLFEISIFIILILVCVFLADSFSWNSSGLIPSIIIGYLCFTSRLIKKITTSSNMQQIIFVGYWFQAPITFLRSSLACLNMFVKLVAWNIQFTIFTILSSLRTILFMRFQLCWIHLTLAESASRFLMKFFIMFFFVIDVIHLSTVSTFFYISPAVSEVSRHLRLWEQLQAVFALLLRFGHG